jgi:putative SOS response-associated peptidase YedK
MCAIDYVRSKSAESLFRRYGVKAVLDGPIDRVNYPMRPRMIVRGDRAGERVLAEANWGLVPFWAKDVKIGRLAYNARDDSLAAGKPMFKSAFERRRCLLIATSYVEYGRVDGKAVPMEFDLDGGEPYAYAGLWESWGRDETYMESCTMVTVEPNELVAKIVPRMPAILRPEDYAQWLDRSAKPEDLFAVLRPYPAERMECHATTLPGKEQAALF